MLTCSVCGQENDDLAVVCSSCKAYLQTKVDTLDLSRTSWGVLESPVRTMHKVAIARYKNYWVFLSSLFGIAVMLAALWHGNVGTRIGGLGPCLLVGFLAGPPLGVACIVAGAFVARVVNRIFGGTSAQRTTMGVLAYSMVPVALTVVVVFPIEVAVFGGYLFDPNPSPREIDPVAYSLLLGLDGALTLWSVVLAWIGLHVAQRAPWWRSLLAVCCMGGMIVGVVEALSRI